VGGVPGALQGWTLRRLYIMKYSNEIAFWGYVGQRMQHRIRSTPACGPSSARGGAVVSEDIFNMSIRPAADLIRKGYNDTE